MVRGASWGVRGCAWGELPFLCDAEPDCVLGACGACGARFFNSILYTDSLFFFSRKELKKDAPHAPFFREYP